MAKAGALERLLVQPPASPVYANVLKVNIQTFDSDHHPPLVSDCREDGDTLGISLFLPCRREQ